MPRWASDELLAALRADQSRPIPTRAREFVQSEDVAYAQAGATSGVLRLWLSDGRTVEAERTLSQLKKTLPGRWAYAGVRCLVNLDQVLEVSGRQGDYRLHFAGLKDPVRLSREQTYLAPLRKALGLRTLDHPTPYDPVAKWLREHDLIDFGFREAAALDLLDAPAVEAFKRAWDLRQFTFERIKEHFQRRTSDDIDILLLIRNIIWQTRRWIEWGLEPKYEGNIRTYWYGVQAAIGHHSDIVEHVSANAYNDVLTRMVVDEQLFKYADIGFTDLRERYRAVGQKRPWLLLVSEKEGHFYPIRRLATPYGASYACTKGQAPHIMIEYLADELAAGGVDLANDTLHIYTINDYDWAGKGIAESLCYYLKRDTAVRNIEHHPLVLLEDYTDEEVELARTPGARFTREPGAAGPTAYPPGANQGKVTKAYAWWKALGHQVPRLHTKTFIGGKWVHTIWKVSADALPWEKIEARFNTEVAALPRTRHRLRRRPHKPAQSS